MKFFGAILLLFVIVETQATFYLPRNVCLNPPKPAHGYVKVKSYLLKYRITWGCNKGFVLVGKSTAYCTVIFGLRGVKVPRCVPLCPEPRVPENGGISSHGPFKVGDTVKFFCNDGFRLDGERKLTCESDDDEEAEWSDDFPTCEPEEATCPKPGVPDNGKVVGGDEAPFRVDDTIVYGCNKGFKLVGEDTLTCQSDGTFDIEVPKCKKIICQSPGVPDNGRVAGGDKAPFTVGEVIIYECNKGFKLFGDSKITCQANGKFDGGLPKCKEIIVPKTCPRPHVGPNVVIDPYKNSYPVGYKIKFRCAKSYYYLGGKRFNDVCLKSGVWKYEHVKGLICGAIRY